MATREQVTVPVASRNDRELPETKAVLTQVVWDKSDRTRNSVRTLGMGLLATFIAVFIPILHWFLVPALLVGSFIFSMEKFGETRRNEGGKGECPKCHQPFTAQAAKWGDKQTEICDHCHEDLELRLSAVEPQASPQLSS